MTIYFPNLAMVRKARGYSQGDMKALMGYNTSSRYAQYETGARKPNVIEAQRIAQVLGETVEYLFIAERKQEEMASGLLSQNRR